MHELATNLFPSEAYSEDLSESGRFYFHQTTNYMLQTTDYNYRIQTTNYMMKLVLILPWIST